ncbi:hypothetical protein [Streptomyces rishiriensis]|uniref:hypothetical protein n=1 Tax=Streptomyces rishiriensis TaxID=68264 RepID=UPI0037CD1789
MAAAPTISFLRLRPSRSAPKKAPLPDVRPAARPTPPADPPAGSVASDHRAGHVGDRDEQPGLHAQQFTEGADALPVAGGQSAKQSPSAAATKDPTTQGSGTPDLRTAESAQTWQPGGSGTLVSVPDGFCLDAEASTSGQDGQRVQGWGCAGSVNQVWHWS